MNLNKKNAWSEYSYEKDLFINHATCCSSNDILILSEETSAHEILSSSLTFNANVDQTRTYLDGSISWEANRVNMYYSAAKYPKIQSPRFYLPANINIQVQPEISRNSFNVGNPYLQIALIDTNTSDIHYARLGANQSYTSNIDTVMESSGTTKCYFTIEYEYAASGIRTYVYKFDVIYR